MLSRQAAAPDSHGDLYDNSMLADRPLEAKRKSDTVQLDFNGTPLDSVAAHGTSCGPAGSTSPTLSSSMFMQMQSFPSTPQPNIVSMLPGMASSFPASTPPDTSGFQITNPLNTEQSLNQPSFYKVSIPTTTPSLPDFTNNDPTCTNTLNTSPFTPDNFSLLSSNGIHVRSNSRSMV